MAVLRVCVHDSVGRPALPDHPCERQRYSRAELAGQSPTVAEQGLFLTLSRIEYAADVDVQSLVSRGLFL